MKTRRFVFLVAGFIASQFVKGYDLPPFGELPNLAKEWRVDAQYSATLEFEWSCLALTNSETGDVLAFGARRLAKGEPRTLTYRGNSAHEWAPDGFPCCKGRHRPLPVGEMASLNDGIVTFDITDAQA